ncbi:MAG: adenine phosphoribosyltransferase [Gemmatimonadetes bacterium]|jgi:adenine phosphoribosyltransferase|nr:adenine phosphoribosyltransferase [Gemmatimonadota bacterium]MBT5056639.1 adenine phosphoribosyltransferase [Gemmatimonadota bacterium]MBT5141934.1 adenine phosphoribosyltransferase [Gemmatimonadota bacterium]MBT5589776.1 adenine phosphoribosyltransferase [Gemmatimonadota bacterium]MBT5964047.1 adenine phosphoribosyltransferase [Gemmatimonadota bacterium]
MSDHLRSLIRDIPDFPKPGILFRDITTLLSDAEGLRAATAALAAPFTAQNVDVVVGIEARGFILGTPVALELGVGFVPARKAGKLPFDVVSTSYDLEYGSTTIEMHQDAIAPGARVLIVDDVLATGGTARAVRDLVVQLQGKIVGVAFLLELRDLDGRKGLEGLNIASVLDY